jgi:hypothetical protein
MCDVYILIFQATEPFIAHLLGENSRQLFRLNRRIGEVNLLMHTLAVAIAISQ